MDVISPGFGAQVYILLTKYMNEEIKRDDSCQGEDERI